MSAPYRKKLIEVALPLEAINRESAREKSIRHGHPSTLHLWWARRPLAACRAVLFASIVDDPSSRPDLFPTEGEQGVERQRLFRIIEELVKWDNSNNERVLDAARAEILKSTDGNPPSVLDPFCGGGSIPLEAQRLGLETYASDLNPVAVLITKALIEIPPKFAGKPPVNPKSRAKFGHGARWNGAQGLADDVRYYGNWIRDEAVERIGTLYPKAKLPNGTEATVIAWLWARTVKCPNPACGAQMPLVRSFHLSTKKGNEWNVEAIVDREAKTVRFEVRKGAPTREGTKRRGVAECLVCGTTVDDAALRKRSIEYGIAEKIMATVVQGDRERLYLAPTDDPPLVDAQETPWLEQPLPANPRWFSPPGYGLRTYRDLFTPRQLVALATFSELVTEARERVLEDGDDTAYADAVATYLAFGLSKAVSRNCTLAIWEPGMNRLAGALGRQALPMMWDFAETNPLAGAGGDIAGTVASVSEVVERLGLGSPGAVSQLDATALSNATRMICTDPPYYDNIGYADLSDFFYVWLRQSLPRIYTDVFSTVLTPKTQELVATPYRFDGDRERADRFFETGLLRAFERMREAHDGSYPLTFFYAFKQAESKDGAVSSTGWDTMLSGLLESGFEVTGTWPIRSELVGGLKKDIGALASSIVLACRPRRTDAPVATRRELVTALRAELPAALEQLQRGNIAPVDLAQAAIGPGMAVFSRYAKVMEADGSPMAVRAALGLINQALDEIFAEQEGDFDPDTRFAVTWFDQYGLDEGPFGEADVLARAKVTSVDGLERAGVLVSRAGKVRLLRRDELDEAWDPTTDARLTVWEVAQHLIKRLEEHGEDAAADLLRRVGGLGETARELAYRLYKTCERKGWAQEALAYNTLVIAWPEIARRVPGTPEAQAQQALQV